MAYINNRMSLSPLAQVTQQIANPLTQPIQKYPTPTGDYLTRAPGEIAPSAGGMGIPLNQQSMAAVQAQGNMIPRLNEYIAQNGGSASQPYGEPGNAFGQNGPGGINYGEPNTAFGMNQGNRYTTQPLPGGQVYQPQQMQPQQTGVMNPGNYGGINTTGPGMIPLTGLLGSEQALSQSLGGALRALGGSGGGGYSSAGSGYTGNDTINRPGEYKNIQKGYKNYVKGGNQAFGLQGDLSGLNGQEAFDQAFIDSPVQAFLREQGDRAVTRNSAAMGGLGGGNVMKELTRFGQGLAGTQLQSQIDNLQGMSDQGLSANIARGNLLQGVEGIEANRYGTRMNAQTSQANSARNAGVQMALARSNAILGTGTNMAQGRMNTGAGMSNNINNTASGLADLVNQQGTGLSNITGTGALNMQNGLMQLAQANGMSQEQMAALLGNWQTGQAGQASQLPGIGQFVGNPLDDLGQIASGVGTAWNAYNQSQAPAGTQPTTQPSGTYTGPLNMPELTY